MKEVLLYIGGALPILWGTAHLLCVPIFVTSAVLILAGAFL